MAASLQSVRRRTLQLAYRALINHPARRNSCGSRYPIAPCAWRTTEGRKKAAPVGGRVSFFARRRTVAAILRNWLHHRQDHGIDAHARPRQSSWAGGLSTGAPARPEGRGPSSKLQVRRRLVNLSRGGQDRAHASARLWISKLFVLPDDARSMVWKGGCRIVCPFLPRYLPCHRGLRRSGRNWRCPLRPDVDKTKARRQRGPLHRSAKLDSTRSPRCVRLGPRRSL